MKKYNLLILTILLINYVSAQYSPNTIDKVVPADGMNFYGFDFSLAKVDDPKRTGQNLDKYLHELVGEVVNAIEPKDMEKWLRVENINYRLNSSMKSNQTTNKTDLFSYNYQEIPEQSVFNLVENYSISEKSGTGFLVVYECFSKSRKSVSAYMVFFDIESRKVLRLEHHIMRNGNSYRSFRDYWLPAIHVVAQQCKILGKEKSKK